MTLKDVQFMNGLFMYGVNGDIELANPNSRTMEDLLDNYCMDGVKMHDLMIRIEYIL